MIYTITLNPSIDYILRVDKFNEGKLNRSNYDKKIAGGKGIMVSKLLKNLEMEPTNLGFLGGYTGGFIRNELKKFKINEEFIEIEEDTRINIKLKSDIETEINAKGPNITKEEKNRFLDLFDGMSEKDLVVLSGSVPSSLPKEIYQVIIKKLKKKNIRFIIDTTKLDLYNSLKYNPILIKPNIRELEDLFDTNINDMDGILHYGQKCLELGAKDIIVSLGSEGAVFVSRDQKYFAPPIEGEVVNSVGSGDAMVGGYVYGIEKGLSKKESFKISVATGTGTAFSEDIASKVYVEELLEKVELIQL